MEKFYECAVCGKTYETILERAKCEEKCVVEAEKAAKKLMQEKLETERKENEEAICDELSYINELLAKHYEKYKTFSMTGSYPYLSYVFGRLPIWF